MHPNVEDNFPTYRNSVRCFEIGHFTNLGCLRLVEHLSTAEGLAGLVGLVKPAHTCPIMHLLLRNSAKREVRRSSTKFGGKEKRNMLNPLSLVVAEENDMVHHHVSNLQQKLGKFEKLKRF